MNAFLLGCTGLVGKEILKDLAASKNVEHIWTVSRRLPEIVSEKLTPVVNEDPTQWPDEISKHPVATFFSAFGTTRAAAGSAQKFIDIDYGYNYEAAKLAKAAGTQTFVLVSLIGASANSFILYSRTKGKLEDDITALGFERLIILRPGVLLGDRAERKGFGDGIASSLGKMVHGTMFSFTVQPVYASDVARVAVAAAMEPIPENNNKSVRIIAASEINKWAHKLAT